MVYGFVLLIFVFLVSVFIYDVTASWSLRVIRLLFSSVLFVLLSRVFEDSEQLLIFVKGIVFIGLISVLYGIKQDLLGFTASERNYLLSEIGFARSPEYFTRIFSFWGSPTVYAGISSCALWSAISLGGLVKTQRRRYLLWIIIGCLSYGVWISRMRIFFFANIIGVIVFLFLTYPSKRLQLITLLLIAVVLGFLINGFLEFEINSIWGIIFQDFNRSVDENASFRFELWHEWLSAIGLRVFGTGTDPIKRLGIKTPDNTYIFILASTGWIGLLIYGYVIWRLVISPVFTRVQRASNLSVRKFWSGHAAFLMVALIAGMTSSIMINSVFAPYFWLFAGMSGLSVSISN